MATSGLRMTLALLVLLASGLAEALVALTTSNWDVQPGQPFTITWTNANGLVTLMLMFGNSPSNLKTLETLGSGLTGTSFTWTPSTSLASGTYVVKIQDGSGGLNYSPQFTIGGSGSGGGGGGATSSSAAPTSTPTTIAPAVLPVPSESSPPPATTSAPPPPAATSAPPVSIPGVPKPPDSSTSSQAGSSTGQPPSSSAGLPSGTGTAAATSPSPSQSQGGSSGESSSNSSSSSSRLSTGATAGIGAASGLVGAAMLSGIGWLIYARGKAAGQRSGVGDATERRAELGPTDPKPKPELEGNAINEMHTSYNVAEMGDGGPVGGHDTGPAIAAGHGQFPTDAAELSTVSYRDEQGVSPV